MSEGKEPRPALSPEFLWRVLVGGNITSLAVVLFVFHRMTQTAMIPELGLWLFAAGVVLIAPSIVYRSYADRRRHQRGKGNEYARHLAQMNRVVIACGLAELPGLFGTVYYLFARDWWGTGMLLLVTVWLLLQARPRE